MTTVAIIAEYNPFHNGHKYQIEKAKELTGANQVVVIMSGNFVQRGAPAILDKYTRAKHAVKNGASLVMELPVCYATSSAELFALSAVDLINRLGIVDYLSFGCESDDIDKLLAITDMLAEENDLYQHKLRQYLSEGKSFPLAREMAVTDYFHDESIPSILNSPNNILAIEYLKAIRKTNSLLKPVPIKRTDFGYHSHSFNGRFASASGIRTVLQHDPDKIDDLKNVLPDNVFMTLPQANAFTDTNTFDDMMAYKLFCEDDFSDYYDISPFLSNRICNLKNTYRGFDSFIDLLMTKNETYTHISRALVHILLGLKKKEMNDFRNELPQFVNILAINKDSLHLLKEIKNTTDLNIINKFGEYYKSSSGLEKQLLDINIKSDTIYRYISAQKGNIIKDDFTISFQEKII